MRLGGQKESERRQNGTERRREGDRAVLSSYIGCNSKRATVLPDEAEGKTDNGRATKRDRCRQLLTDEGRREGRREVWGGDKEG